MIQCTEIENALVSAEKLMRNLELKIIDKVSSIKAHRVKTLDQHQFLENNRNKNKAGTSERD